MPTSKHSITFIPALQNIRSRSNSQTMHSWDLFSLSLLSPGLFSRGIFSQGLYSRGLYSRGNYSRGIFLLGLFLLSAPAYSQTSAGQPLSSMEAASQYDAETTYSIYRKGNNIGQHSLKVTTSDNTVNVSVDSRITVRILKIPVFKFSYVSNEIWQNNQLVSVDSTTTTNKDIETASLKNEGGESILSSDNGSETAPLIQYATNHWHIGATNQTELFNTVKGLVSKVSVNKNADVPLVIGKTTLSTTHYQYTGDLTVESWYDTNGRWVKLAFQGSDGSEITYLIDNP